MRAVIPLAILTSCLSLVAGCGASPPPDQGAVGFEVRVETTRFDVGSVLSDVTSMGFRRTVGTHGTYLSSVASRGSIGALDATTSLQGFGGDMGAHEALVRGYYDALGFPFAQRGDVTTSVSSGSGPIEYTTIWSRVVDGVSVPDSVVRASCESVTRCVDEFIFWPRIPGAFIVEAKDFGAYISGPKGAAYLSSLPNGGVGARVVIHHSDWKGSVVSFCVTCDVVDGAVIRSFARDGSVVTKC